VEIDKSKIKTQYLLKGTAVSPGIAISKAFVLRGDWVDIDDAPIEEVKIGAEVQKFEKAVTKAKSEIRYLQNKVVHRIGEESAKIFDVHKMLLEDSVIIDETVNFIKESRKGADFAFYQVMEKYKDSLTQSDIEIFQGRIADLEDVKKRVIRHIQGDKSEYLNKFTGSAVIVSTDLAPSDAVKLGKHKAHGFATDMGGRTSHVAIMARSMEVPAVVGLRRLSRLVKDDDRIIVDGNLGYVLINPEETTIKYYRELQERYYDVGKKLAGIRDLPCITLDGKEIELSANLEFSDEVDTTKSYGAKGIGLYRTDYIYLAGDELPSEEEQYEEYKKIVDKVYPETVIIRTMDLGGDKQPKSFIIPPEENPFLGWRAIRISLASPELFNIQLRAILRASSRGNVKLLYPMISGLEEIRECNIALENAKAELRKEKIPFDKDLDVGVMIEVPSAAVMAYEIAKEVDFLSIGTNDLVQYMLAVDRGNERISYLYKHLDPAVLRTIKQIIQQGHNAGVWVGMCGEMASDPLSTLILLGLELDEFSVSPSSVPEIKEIIRSTDYQEAVRIANKALEFNKASDVERFMLKVMRQRFKDLNF